MVFEINVSPDIKNVLWYVDNALMTEATTFPFSATWIPQKGTHIIHARGMTETGKEVRSRDTGIAVIEFKGGDRDY